MRRLIGFGLAAISAWLLCVTPAFAELRVSASAVALSVGAATTVNVTGASGSVSVASMDPRIATAKYASGQATIRAVAVGKTKINVKDREHTVTIAVTVSGSGSTPPPPPVSSSVPWRVLASNDLGMHCADLDYQVFSILPPFNVVHAQVVLPGTATTQPKLLTGTDADVAYRATSSLVDPVAAGSINTTSGASSIGAKTNFWDPATLPNGVLGTLGALAYRLLYPNAVLDAFAPIPSDTGLPVPDPAQLPQLAAGQQRMPSPSNLPQKFNRFDSSLPFFKNFPFGTTVANANWFSADGIPIVPVDDAGRSNPYPLMRVQAVAKGANPATASNVRGSVDIVLPVASEADCKNCHNGVDGIAAVFASVTRYKNGQAWPIAQEATAPGPDKVNNAAKINILRLHDAKWGFKYTTASGAASACVSGNESSCLDKRRAIQCSQCHYSPALDLAQVGPIDEPAVGVNGRQQTRHESMSRVMHDTHGQYSSLFPAMPLPGSGRTLQVQADVLQQTCYQCHPGKQTKCLRGAMGAGGAVCQDCHGSMKQVGNDFTAKFPTTNYPAGADLTKRVPWAAEPKCQSCHVGDAKTVTAMNRSDYIVSPDGIRNLMAYTKSSATATAVSMISSPASRFAEDQALYRLSKGHGGVACQNCHGSTHAEWPNPNPYANDNVAASQLQGHSGTLVECSTCHAPGSLGLTLNGPHGMHPVNDPRWTADHGDFAESRLDSCRTCHGMRGEGTVLSRVAVTRSLPASEEGTRTITLQQGTPVRCNLCHENKL
jgi:hypothetical protein